MPLRPARLTVLSLGLLGLTTLACEDDTASKTQAGADAGGGTWTPPVGGTGPGGSGGAGGAAPTGGASGSGGASGGGAATGGQVGPAGGGSGGGGSGGGSGGAAGGAEVHPFDCATDLSPAATIGQPCDTGDACGPGGVCAGETLPDGRVCYQLCVPQQCEDLCNGQRCRPVVGPDGEPVELSPGVPLGACAFPPPPGGEPFSPCDAEHPCGPLSDCVSLAGQPTHQCLPRCEAEGEACDPSGLCAAGADAEDASMLRCVLPCDAPDACAVGLACLEFLGALACLPAP